MSAELHARLSSRLEASRTGDGFGPRAGLPPEPEPTALAAIALDDEDARAWLLDHQRADGGFALVVGTVVNDSATGLAALALPPGDAREQHRPRVFRRRYLDPARSAISSCAVGVRTARV